MLFSSPGRLFMASEIESRNETPEYTLALSKCTLPCFLEIVSVVILAEMDFMIASNNGTVSHYITVHIPVVFQTSKAPKKKA